MKTSPLAVMLAFLAAIVLGTAVASPALAHTSLKSSDPKKGATVESIDEIRLTFTESVKLPSVVLNDADGKAHQDGRPEVDGAVVTQRVAGTLPAGKYTIAWRVVSADGHPVVGEIPFTVRAAEPEPSATTPSAIEATPVAPAVPATPAPDTPVATPAAGAEQDAAQEGGSGVPGWVWIVVLGLAGVGIGMVISLRKQP
ncbi:copper resistance protein CopC [Sphaerisporangium rufum]|uniref:Copper resistance protein CopC n=1 Tax=Sphaerisporangium rufum TaxID=1381558 RepID=A0A919QXH9_9ACTN|nr:copper resistance CopC family protein [Sphaerisporangium rufum]GII75936.1 copper resistance protein CopC [Sphaerisporangium rufum]